MEAAAERVTYQLPNEHSRVGYLLEAIQCSDTGLQAAMASIKTDQSADGLRNKFEAAATHLMPDDPVQKKRTSGTGGKRDYAEISDTHGTEVDVSAFGAKKGIRKTGVHLRYHSPPKYAQLTKEEKDELREWRLTSGTEGNKGKSSPKSGKEFKKPHVRFDQNKAMASAVEKKVAERLNAINQSKTKEDELKAYIMSIVKRHSGVQVDVSATDTIEVVKPPLLPTGLKGIIRRAKNGPP
jgi:hypothetical protein